MPASSALLASFIASFSGSYRGSTVLGTIFSAYYSFLKIDLILISIPLTSLRTPLQEVMNQKGILRPEVSDFVELSWDTQLSLSF